MTDSRLDRVRKLLAKAQSVAGTPEADVFNAKAFELIAKYGIDEAAARATTGDGPAPILRSDITHRGPYQMQQCILASALGDALGCAVVRMGAAASIVFGTAAAIERLTMLQATLRLQMFSGAATVSRHSAAATKVARRRWMESFAHVVGSRLANAEQQATTASPGAALVLVDDAKRAARTMRTEVNVRSTQRRTRIDVGASADGAAAGRRADIGQSRMSGRRAISA